MESTSFQQQLVPWGSETRLHSGPYMDRPGASLRPLPPSGPHPCSLGMSPCSPSRSPTWLNPVDTRCSWVPVHTSRPSLLFSWACVLCRRQERKLNHPRATSLTAQQSKGGARSGPPGSWLDRDWGSLISLQDGPQLKAVLHLESRPAPRLGSVSLLVRELSGCPAHYQAPLLQRLGRVACHCPCRCPGGSTQLLVTIPRLWGPVCPLRISFFSLMHGLMLPRLPTTQGCREDQLRLYVRETGLLQSAVQIKGLLELLLPPDAARGPGRGPGAKLCGMSLERHSSAPLRPPMVLGLPAGRLTGTQEGEA